MEFRGAAAHQVILEEVANEWKRTIIIILGGKDLSLLNDMWCEVMFYSPDNVCSHSDTMLLWNELNINSSGLEFCWLVDGIVLDNLISYSEIQSQKLHPINSERTIYLRVTIYARWIWQRIDWAFFVSKHSSSPSTMGGIKVMLNSNQPTIAKFIQSLSMNEWLLMFCTQSPITPPVLLLIVWMIFLLVDLKSFCVSPSTVSWLPRGHLSQFITWEFTSLYNSFRIDRGQQQERK